MSATHGFLWIILRPERLCYYAYATYFYYLHEHLTRLMETQDQNLREAYANDIVAYFDSWVARPLATADALSFPHRAAIL